MQLFCGNKIVLLTFYILKNYIF